MLEAGEGLPATAGYGTLMPKDWSGAISLHPPDLFLRSLTAAGRLQQIGDLFEE